MNLFLLGAIAMASLVAAGFFLRFWRDTGDLLFLLFALAFGLEGVNRTLLALSPAPNEGDIGLYVVRFLAYALIVAGIASKNLSRLDPR
jgi:uncharacterized membrane protein HdeD (DUF308 family)